MLYNAGPANTQIQKPVLMYCEELSTFVCWVTVATLEVVYSHHVPVAKEGCFVKAIACENFDRDSKVVRVFSTSCVYAVSCTDNRIHFYQQKAMEIRYLISFNIGNVTQHKLWYLPIH